MREVLRVLEVSGPFWRKRGGVLLLVLYVDGVRRYCEETCREDVLGTYG